MVQTETIPVYGMMCGHCVKAVTMALEDIEGVRETHVSLEDSCARVTFDDGVADLENLKAAIVEEGYTLEPQEEETQDGQKGAPPAQAEAAVQLGGQVSFKIEGMSCVNCASAIEKAFSRVDGIGKVSINFSLEKGFVEFDKAMLDEQAVLQVDDRLVQDVDAYNKGDQNENGHH